MNPFQMSPIDMGVGFYVFYNLATRQYFMEKDMNLSDFTMFRVSPVIDFIGFFKSVIQAQDTIDACIKLEQEKVQRNFQSPSPYSKYVLSQQPNIDCSFKPQNISSITTSPDNTSPMTIEDDNEYLILSDFESKDNLCNDKEVYNIDLNIDLEDIPEFISHIKNIKNKKSSNGKTGIDLNDNK